MIGILKGKTYQVIGIRQSFTGGIQSQGYNKEYKRQFGKCYIILNTEYLEDKVMKETALHTSHDH